MIPGSPHPMLRAGGDHWSSHHKIGHSIRLRGSVGGHMARLFAANATDNSKLVIFFVMRKHQNGVSHRIFETTPLNGGVYTALQIMSTTDQFIVTDGNTNTITYAPSLRDPSEHYFVMLVHDNSQVGVLKWRLFINNIEAQGTGSAPANNGLLMNGYSTRFNVDYTGAGARDITLSSITAVDGQTAASMAAFIRTCPEKGHLEPIPYAGTFGNNGFILPFDDGTSTTTLGYDRSGNNNNFTLVNVSRSSGVTDDWSLDTPTNHFPTFNSLFVNTTYPIVYSNGNMTASRSSGGLGGITSTIGMSSGKWYVGEFKFTGQARNIGITNNPPGSLNGSEGNAGYNGGGGNSYGIVPSSGVLISNGVPGATYSTFATSNIVSILYDADDGKFYLAVDGTLMNSADLGTGTGYLVAGLTGRYFPMMSIESGGSIDGNFGQRPFDAVTATLRAGAVAAGFKVLCAANEPEPVIVRRKSAFVAVTDSGANVAGTLAAARAGWADYIEIFKRRDAAEGWRWRFASDPGNYLDSSNTAEKAAFPALAGTSYVGYALKVSAQNGVATGTFAHVNGVADTINDGLGTARKAIILRRESVGGGDWAFYHPDLTAGKLLFLNLGDAETTNATISGVTSNAFVAAAALPSGTYRWISIAEVSGLIGLGRHVGNYSTDGPMDSSDHSPALVLIKNKSRSACTWILHDSTRSPFNPSNNTIYPNNNSQENASPNETIDMLSSGFKLRNISSDINYTAPDEYVYLSIGQSSRYANAR